MPKQVLLELSCNTTPAVSVTAPPSWLKMPVAFGPSPIVRWLKKLSAALAVIIHRAAVRRDRTRLGVARGNGKLRAVEKIERGGGVRVHRAVLNRQDGFNGVGGVSAVGDFQPTGALP